MVRSAHVALLVALSSLAVACGDGAATTSSGAGGASTGTPAGSPTGTGTGTGTNTGLPGSGGGDPAPGWYELAPVPEPLQENAVVALDGEVVVIGGFDAQAQVVDRVEAYDPSGDTWRSLAALPAERHHVNAAVVDGRIYVVGSLIGLSFTAAGDVWAYDPAADAWEPRAPMPAGSERGGSAVGVIGTTIYVAGGLRGGDAVADVSAYDTLADQWTSLPSLPGPRDHLVGGVVDGLFYAIGGRQGGIGGIEGDVFAFDPSSPGWTDGAPMITPRGGTAAATLSDGRIVVLGGEGNLASGTGVFAEVEAYAAPTDEWAALSPMTIPRHGTGAAAIDDVIYMPGGATTQAFGAVADNQALVLR